MRCRLGVVFVPACFELLWLRGRDYALRGACFRGLAFWSMLCGIVVLCCDGARGEVGDCIRADEVERWLLDWWR